MEITTMADDATATTEETAAAAQTSGDSTEATATEATTTEGESALGDAGKKALDAMKAERKTARDQAAAEKARADALQAKLDGKEADYAKEQERRETEQAALAKANDRIRRSEVKAAAKGVLTDPTDAYKYLDLDSFEVTDDGDVDAEAIAAALEELVKNKPYLAVQDGKRFQGGADGGARKESPEGQLSQADVTRLASEGKHEEIEAARAAGRLNNILGIK